MDEGVAVVDGEVRTEERNRSAVVDTFIYIGLMGTDDNAVVEFVGVVHRK